MEYAKEWKALKLKLIKIFLWQYCQFIIIRVSLIVTTHIIN